MITTICTLHLRLQVRFSVEADLTTFGYQDIHLGLGSYWAGSKYDRTGLRERKLSLRRAADSH